MAEHSRAAMAASIAPAIASSSGSSCMITNKRSHRSEQVRRDAVQRRAQHVVQRAVGRRRADRVEDVVEPALGDRRDTFRLTGEVVREGPPRDSGTLGDVGDRYVLVAAFGEKAQRRLRHRPAGRVLLALPQADGRGPALAVSSHPSTVELSCSVCKFAQ